EYNVDSNKIEQKDLMGGYAMVNYMLKIKSQLIFPFVKYQVYEGGKKHELDARSYSVSDWEFGVEWQPIKNFELVAMYVISDRRYEDAVLKNNHQKGNLLRLQAQFNF
ncbi:MAG: porin, partial [Bacteroidia bacterium]|nr:porin [Bacteroidia bacterium]